MSTLADPHVESLARVLPKCEITTRTIDRLAYAHDASLYRFVPRAIVRPTTADEISTLFQWCIENKRHCTFRTAGTSLSGQAVSDDIIIDLSRNWSTIQVLDSGKAIRCQPGARGGYVNGVLRSYGRKLGPDPASMEACMVGGIAANNASGMCCGTQHNTYHTMESVGVLLADGTFIDTAEADCDESFRQSRPDLYDALLRMRDEIRTNAPLVERIQRKYRIKNTIGYSINAFLDEDRPAHILGRLMIGSEGTLGFISHIVYRTIPDASEKYTAVFIYDSLQSACDAVPGWTEAGAAAIELMDDASVRSIASLPQTSNIFQECPVGSTALLVEFHDTVPPDNNGYGVWTGWLTQPNEQAELWKLRKGLMPTLGARRPKGTTMINEDVAVPPHALADLVRDVQAAFVQHGYTEAIIFGHAKDGNIHFVVNQRFETDKDLEQYERFMASIAEIVVDRHSGSLKAEHGTGRNMAPFVEHEWGTEAYHIMRRVKSLLDPHNVLNPGVLLNEDKRTHLRNIKPVPSVDEEIDRCIECGFCEHVCPSKGVTLTPRQRIVLRRERVINRSQSKVVKEIDDAFAFDGIETCATDGICASSCPVSIDTGSLVKRLRSERHTRLGQSVARWLSHNYVAVDATSRTLTRMISFVGSSNVSMFTTWLRSVGINVPRVYAAMGRPAIKKQMPSTDAPPDAILMASCVSRWMSGHETQPAGVSGVLFTLAQRAGVRVVIADKGSLCCGQTFASKGFPQAAQTVRTATFDELAKSYPGVPIVVDTSTCAASMLEENAAASVQVQSAIDFCANVLMPRLTIARTRRHVVLHLGCGTAKLQARDRVIALASACAERITVPLTSACCGFAGDKGMFQPSVAASAIGEISSEIDTLSDVDGCYACNTTCEIGLSEYTHKEWHSIFELLEEATR